MLILEILLLRRQCSKFIQLFAKLKSLLSLLDESEIKVFSSKNIKISNLCRVLNI